MQLDKDKIAILTMQIKSIVYPNVEGEQAKKIVEDTRILLDKVINHIKQKTDLI